MLDHFFKHEHQTAQNTVEQGLKSSWPISLRLFAAWSSNAFKMQPVEPSWRESVPKEWKCKFWGWKMEIDLEPLVAVANCSSEVVWLVEGPGACASGCSACVWLQGTRLQRSLGRETHKWEGGMQRSAAVIHVRSREWQAIKALNYDLL